MTSSKAELTEQLENHSVLCHGAQCMRIALVHGDRLYRESLEFYLVQGERFSVVYSAAKLEAVSAQCFCSVPDLIIIEFGLSASTGTMESGLLRANRVDPKVLVVGVPNSEEDILACIERDGASGYVLKDASLGDLLNNIEAIKRGETICSPRIAGLLSDGFRGSLM
jgi:DNA-binding NarL/FixJ family response regulator